MDERLTIHTSRMLGNFHKCWYCGKVGETISEHFYPKSKGGRLRVRACKECDKEKGSMTPEQWIGHIKITIEECEQNKIFTCYRGSFIKSVCDPECKELERLKRMLQASSSLWERIKNKP